ncbi:hypothetical protein GR11A_00083 [Vibrio phage vB_VcorM_GR11A]|nr:hypothetical protein GR11A_00083 [Vibrio phage vB_VcorM_GR11A]
MSTKIEARHAIAAYQKTSTKLANHLKSLKPAQAAKVAKEFRDAYSDKWHKKLDKWLTTGKYNKVIKHAAATKKFVKLTINADA